MKRQLSIVIIFLFLIACTPSGRAIQESIPETQIAVPTFTATTIFTFTPSPIPSLTPTATPDLRIITLKADRFLLSVDDLPADGQYFIHSGDMGRSVSNEEMGNRLGAGGQRLVEQAGRIEGWWVSYSRGANKYPGPLVISNTVDKCSSSQGARMLADLSATYGGFIRMPDTPQIGDYSLETSQESDAIPGYKYYRIAFMYRNYVEVLDGYGRDNVVAPVFLDKLP